MTIDDGIDEMTSYVDPVEVVASHADDQWIEAARGVIRHMSDGFDFIAEDIRIAVDGLGYSTTDHRALGSVIREANRTGQIEMTGKLRRAATSHGSFKPEWRRSR
jgi:hypothetical protein